MNNTYTRKLKFLVPSLLVGTQYMEASSFSTGLFGDYLGLFLILFFVICISILLFSGFIYLRKLIASIPRQQASVATESTMLISKNSELEKQLLETKQHNETLQTQCDQYKQDNAVLIQYKNELEEQHLDESELNIKLQKDLDVLVTGKKESELMLLSKIKEYDLLKKQLSEKEVAVEEGRTEVEHLKDQFFIDMIHEMRTPLSMILGSLTLVIQNEDKKKDMSAQLLTAYRNTLSMQDLADQLTGLKRSDSMVGCFRVARYNLMDILQQICDIYVDWVAMNQIDFYINSDISSLWVWIDRRKIEFAFRMLLSNALKSSFAYGKVSIEVSIVKEDGNSYCRLDFQDEGLDESQSTRRGLKQIKEMIDSMGGHYSAYSDNSGSMFSLFIRLGRHHFMDDVQVEFIKPEEDLIKLNQSQKEDIAELIRILPKPQLSGKTILIVDDSFQIRWLVRQVFEKEYNILEAFNGAEGLRIASEEKPDIILCDVMMPVMDGIELCRKLKSNPETSRIPIVMLTAKVESEDIVVGLEAGADDYIVKPFELGIVRTKVINILKRTEMINSYILNASNTQATKEETPRSLFMDSVIESIEDHLNDSTFEAKILADEMNMSLPTLYRKIKQFSDLSILELTRNIRLKKAAELLSSQRYSVQEVADMVGFNDTATFRKRFTEQYGVTPSQYPHR